jgi:DEAD/DEAH box helicase domain-containing protein
LASATIGNPAELAERLTGLDVDVIEADAAPRGRKLFAMWNPPIIDDETGARRSALAEASTVMTKLVDDGARTIGFTRSRRAAELLAEFLSVKLFAPLMERLKADRPELRADLVASQLVGIGMARYVLALEPLASADADQVVAWVGPTLQRYLTGKLE